MCPPAAALALRALACLALAAAAPTTLSSSGGRWHWPWHAFDRLEVTETVRVVHFGFGLAAGTSEHLDSGELQDVLAQMLPSRVPWTGGGARRKSAVPVTLRYDVQAGGTAALRVYEEALRAELADAEAPAGGRLSVSVANIEPALAALAAPYDRGEAALTVFLLRPRAALLGADAPYAYRVPGVSANTTAPACTGAWVGAGKYVAVDLTADACERHGVVGAAVVDGPSAARSHLGSGAPSLPALLGLRSAADAAEDAATPLVYADAAAEDGEDEGDDDADDDADEDDAALGVTRSAVSARTLLLGRCASLVLSATLGVACPDAGPAPGVGAAAVALPIVVLADDDAALPPPEVDGAAVRRLVAPALHSRGEVLVAHATHDLAAHPDVATALVRARRVRAATGGGARVPYLDATGLVADLRAGGGRLVSALLDDLGHGGARDMDLVFEMAAEGGDGFGASGGPLAGAATLESADAAAADALAVLPVLVLHLAERLFFEDGGTVAVLPGVVLVLSGGGAKKQGRKGGKEAAASSLFFTEGLPLAPAEPSGQQLAASIAAAAAAALAGLRAPTSHANAAGATKHDLTFALGYHPFGPYGSTLSDLSEALTAAAPRHASLDLLAAAAADAAEASRLFGEVFDRHGLLPVPADPFDVLYGTPPPHRWTERVGLLPPRARHAVRAAADELSELGRRVDALRPVLGTSPVDWAKVLRQLRQWPAAQGRLEKWRSVVAETDELLKCCALEGDGPDADGGHGAAGTALAWLAAAVLLAGGVGWVVVVGRVRGRGKAKHVPAVTMGRRRKKLE